MCDPEPVCRFLNRTEPLLERVQWVDHEGFQAVFDGKTFDGWAGAVANYEVADGAIRCQKGKGGALHTKAEYGDFVARVEFKLPEAGNNGLLIRYPGEGEGAYTAMCELQVLDSEHPQYATLDVRQYHGSAYGMAAAHRGYLRPTGQWNFQEVQSLNDSVQLYSNLDFIETFLDNFTICFCT